jgi:hypothetical protein
MVHVNTGSGMAMAWKAFTLFPMTDHSIFQTIRPIHLPFVGDEIGVFRAVEELMNWKKIKKEVLDYALSVCPHSVTGTCYYAGGMADLLTVPVCIHDIQMTIF